MNIRRWIAKRLYPREFRDAEAYHWMKNEMAYDLRWLGYDFPQIEAYIDRFQKRDFNHWRGLDTKPMASKWSHDISVYREEMRKAFPPSDGTSRPRVSA